jgi:AcrR family transcriptional regulator
MILFDRNTESRAGLIYNLDMDEELLIEATGLEGQRGPVDHKRRQQILQAADRYFRLYGYKKTSLVDIAKAINISTPYLYKFFESKQAIGEAICSHTLDTILSEVEEWVAATDSPVEKIRRIFNGLEKRGWFVLNEERKIHDMVLASFEEHWSSHARFKESLYQMIRTIVIQGRESGDFERKTPLEETCRAIARMTDLFFHPVLLEQAGKSQADEATAVANVVVRSLTA